jgi:hypothetical protein
VLVLIGCGGHSTSFGGNEGPSEAGAAGAAAAASGSFGTGGAAGNTDAGAGGATAAGAAGSPGSGGAAGSTDAGAGGATAAGAAGSSGTGAAAGSADAGTGGAPVGPNIDGEWAMIGFEDPVAVALGQQGTVISGYGCCVGLRPPSGVECCGPIIDGSIVDRRARFGFSFDVGAIYEYSADVTVSSDGQRMLGPFSRFSWPTAWVRIDAVDLKTTGWLSDRNTVVSEAVRERVGSYALALAATTADGDDFSPDAVYRFLISGPLPLVWGDLGPFWSGEMSWLADEETLVVGPVPVTDPAFPIGLRLHFEAVVLTSVEADMASGARYSFHATFD